MKKTITQYFIGIFFVFFFFSCSNSYGQAGVGIPFGFTVGAPLAPALTNVAVAATGADESKFILAGAGFNMPFAGTSYPLVLASTNGWAALLPASDLSGLVTTTTNSVAVAANATTITLTSAFGVANGMYVSGTGIFGGNGYAQVLNVAGNVITINIGSTAVAIGAGTYNFYNLTAPAFFNTAVPGNSLSTYAAQRPMIAPLWDDLSTSVFSYSVTAAAVNIKWNCKWDKTNALATLTFILTLNNTGNITFSYPNVAYTVSGSPTASIGLAGICSGDYYSANPTSATTAVFDSTLEYSNITGVGANRLSNASITWNPFSPNDNCSGASHPAKDLGTINTSCTYTAGSNVNATTSGSNICATTDNKDVWYKFTKPAGTTNVLITTIAGTCQAAAGTTIEAFATCGGTSLGCATTSVGNPNFGELSLSRPCASEVLYVRVTVDGDVTGKFQICVKDNGLSTTTGTDCSSATPICGLPFSAYGLNTAGFGNDYDSANAQCHDPFLNGEDYVFSFTPSVTTCAKILVSTTGINPGLFVYDGCPNSGTTHCLNSTAGITGIIGISSVTFLAGVTYYIVVDNNPLNATNNIPFDITLTSLATAVAYDPCSNAVNLGSIANNTPCTFSTYTTECAQPTAAGTIPVPTCGNFYDGVTGDVWLKFTATFSGSLLVKTQPSAANPTSDAAMAIYIGGSCAALSLFACDDNSAGSSMPLLSIPVAIGTTYYIRIWTVNPGNTGNFDLCLTSACSPPNDLPCQAIYIPLGGTAAGFNTCSGATNEPPSSAQCTAGGIVNTVWYKTVVPASGTIKIRTHPLTLTDTQIQAFTFASGCANSTTTYTSRGCNDDGPDCGSQTNQSYHDYSELTLSGQVVGDTIYIAVDGFNSMTGTFEITAIDGTGGALTPVYLQDCEYPYEVCGSTNISVPDPGPLNFGNICDFQPSYDCWQNGERNSIWYRVTVNPGTLQFAINSVTDYDFIMWDVTGVSNACAQIQAHTLPSIRCNWVTTTGQTGISTANPDASWEASIPNAGVRSYLILIDNWNPPSWVTGFTLDWMGSPIASNPTSVSWNGSIDTSFSSTGNWGTAPCNALPSCSIDAIITTSVSGNQPTMTVNTQVNNLVINSGASLRIKTGVTLDICGDFTNNGTLIAEPGSTVRFQGTINQTINGNLIGVNSFANLVILKTTGTVSLNCNIDVAQNFSTQSATSIFNINGKTMKIAGNFTNNTGNTTFTGIASSNVEFNGTVNQFFTNVNGAGGITLNRVRMNKTSGKLYLIGANSKLSIDTVLTLTQGIINTRNVAALEVFVKNNATAAVTGHSVLSYIDGKLRRAVYVGSPLTLPFSLDYPIGDSLSPGGYELANITFTSGTVIPDILGYFSPWPSGPPALGPTASECMIATYDAKPLFDHGFWTFSKTSISPFNGIYKLTLYNTNVSNNSGSGWTIAKADIAANPSLTASWSLIGQCLIASTANATQRVNINGTNPYSVTTISGSNIITTPFSPALPGTTNMSVGATVSGVGILAGSVITAILTATTFTISNNATASGTVTASVGSTANSGTSFNHLYAIVQSTVPLPIELLSFTAEPDGESVLCKWVTASETNNDYFEVLRSNDGIEYKEIGIVNGYGAGTSTDIRNYKFVDNELCSSIRYYKLKQIDIDNNFSYSDVVAVNCINGENQIKFYPNPATNELTISFFQNNKDDITIELLDLLGKTIRTELFQTVKGFNKIITSVHDLPNGIYYLRIKSGKGNPIQEDRQIRFVKE